MSKVTKKSKLIKSVEKRNGQVVAFDIERITIAIKKAMLAANEGSLEEAGMVANKVFADLVRISKKHPTFVPTVEGIQNSVEKELMLSEYVVTAKAYILYREERTRLRYKGIEVSEKVKKLAMDSKKYFRNPLGEFVYYRTYSKWIPEENRRETWIETVDRYMDFMKENLGKKLKDLEYKEVREAILKQEAMPSMRLLQFAGNATRVNNICAYNCSYIAPEKWRDFSEIMFISMSGTGVGWSVESDNIQKLPQIKRQTGKKLATFVVPDSKEGWAEALTLGMETWASGLDIDFDFSQLRPVGARLKTMGGKSAGPEPLRDLLAFTRRKMLTRQGKRLENINAHDIICKIGENVVAGGVRRSAMISLSDLDDVAVRDAKKGQFWNTDPQRMLANNSAVYESKPTNEEFMDEWIALMKSKSGERGIYNREGLKYTLPKRRLDQFGPDQTPRWGGNPCGEIILQSKQFCNLSEIVARVDDTEKSLLRKLRIATILGTYQASLTNFPYLSAEWKENCEKEALLGVSITGQFDCPAVRTPEMMRKLKLESIKVNKMYARRFGINQSTCITCVKPSGNLSQTVDSSSGIHPRNSAYYIRRARIASTDALFKMLRDQGVPFHPEVGQTLASATTFVFDFPVKAPDKSVFKDDQTAIEQLEYWKMVKENFTEHNPSTTISIGDDEWIEVANWIYKNWNIVGGLAFLPRDNHVYQLAPYEAIDETTYKEMLKRFEHIDFSKIVTYEVTDELNQKDELACVGGVCTIDDIPVEVTKV
ncbi:MAG: Ribonucleoside-triphosphate reductase [Parcubacteria group bacterium GW2011_GWF2_39_8b]|uniref:Ribonucleoside-triphosphate reductase n=3 Tax=Candidatus Zambryskiibacteriota TaxID=1817925 RepID=A0A1G2T621_9BACT|nr:MAG: Ribonucleoside-triphosphate reductase [Parcubacteria group bacterium GW2011_GWF2_39_8b]KKR45907.1 MAG: Ribonucleoside-triphosphate reductase [Parcubacteria group bacterium GW2011_GWA2_40_14]OHA92737.1 MAG: ribonucleoside-triphosphate reductase [Candidatus Zambryskibacteria bacterium RIFCSPHIGHO2_02_38_10.5]OHA95911.1 MAG: ribonucleoside-triphosphate reductase [Candidatus Zambryskibacteria bacterium RIFCSPHIGHO2_02_FULL_39_82]OHA97941.1 MAG: ribonucleoside-triphosphate reductase [Candida